MRLLILIFALLAAPVVSQEIRPLEQDEILDWAASGRIAFNRNKSVGGYTCSGTLIAPDLVVTAAHCLSAMFGAGPTAARQIVFLAGWDGANAVESIGVQRLEFHPAYRPGTTIQEILAYDLVVLHLQRPAARIAPMPLGTLEDPLQKVEFAVYSGAGLEPPQMSRGCSHSELSDAAIQIGCPVIGGNSGGGVLAGNGADRALVAVIFAASGQRALALRPDAWLRAQVAAN